MKILIKNGSLYNEKTPKDILIEGGIIKKIGKNLDVKADKIIDAKDLLITPGLVDMHVHLREPGFEYKEDILSGTRAAVIGGVTAVCAMPNTDPVCDDKSVIDYILDKSAEAGYAKVYPIAAITKGLAGKTLSEFGLLKEAGAVAFSDDGNPLESGQMMRVALEYAKFFDTLIISHCEDKNLVNGGLANEGYNATIAGLKGNICVAEEIMVAREILLAEALSAKVHIAHVSTKNSVELIRQAKKRGVKVTAETCPHYFVLNDSVILDWDSNAKVNPPIRAEADRLAIIEGIVDGTIDVIVTDHAPHHKNDKDVEFVYAANGISGVENSFKLSYTHLVKSGIITLSKLIDLMSIKPAEILALDTGKLREGDKADIAIFDVENMIIIEKDTMESKGKNMPFENFMVYGKTVHAFVDGKHVVDNGLIL